MGKRNFHKSVKQHDTKQGQRLQNKDKMPSVHACSIFPKKDKTLVSSNWSKLSKTLQLNTTKQTEKYKTKFAKKMKTALKKTSHSGGESLQNHENEIWFDNVSEDLLDIKPSSHAASGTSVQNNPLIKVGPHQGPTKVIAMDCEMVGIGEDGKDSMLARVSIVNSLGYCIYDKYVKPRERVTDFRTPVSGIRQENFEHGEDFEIVQKEVYDIMKGRILVGHALKHDLQVLYLDHPRSKIRDTSRFTYFREVSNGRTPSLKRLAEHFLGVKVQQGEHSSVQDAQAAMRLYTMHRKKWEKEIRDRFASAAKIRAVEKKQTIGTTAK